MSKFKIQMSVMVFYDKLIEIEAANEQEAEEQARQYYINSNVTKDWVEASDMGEPDFWIEQVK